MIETIHNPSEINKDSNALHEYDKTKNIENIQSQMETTLTKKPTLSLRKKIIRLIFSNAGLVVFFMLYTCLGASVFQLLEQHEELRRCEEGKGKFIKETQKVHQDLFHYILYNVSRNDFGLDKNNLIIMQFDKNQTELPKTSSNVSENIATMLVEFRDFSIQIKNQYRYMGKDCIENSNWKYLRALEFCVSLITTIGYGHVTPTTWEGKLVCICYTAVGIPIFGLTVIGWSKIFSNVFVIAYITINSYNPWKKKKRLSSKKNHTSSNIDVLMSETRNSRYYSQTINEFLLNEAVLAKRHGSDDTSSYNSDESIDGDDDDDVVQVPASILAATLIIYITIGSVIFRYSEDWKPTESVYFVMTSLLLIGFGDYVPGQKSNDSYALLKFLVMSFYFLFGLSLIGMVIRIAQTAAVRTIKKLSAKIKRIFSDRNRKRKTTDLNCEKEKQEIIARIQMLKTYESILHVRKRNV